MLRRSFVTGLFAVALVSTPLFATFDRDSGGRERIRAVPISNTPGSESALSDLAGDGRNVFLVWREGEREIRLRRSVDGGVSFGDGPSGQVLAEVPRGETIFTLRAAVRGDRVAILMTVGTIPELGEVLLLTSGDGGVTFSGPVRLERSGGSPNADLAIDGEGRLHLVLEDRGATNGILYLWSEDGESFSERALSEGEGGEPRIVAWRKRLAVVWADAGGAIQFATSADSGATFNAPVQVSRSEERASSPSIAAGDSIHVVWTEARELVYVRSSDLGATFGEPAVLADAAQAPRVAVAGSSVRVVWTSGGRSFLLRSSTDGESFGEKVELTAGIAGEASGGVAILPSSFDRIIWPHTATRAPRDAEILLVTTANALSCGTSWKDPVSGNWNDATKWSDGVPVAGANACITADGVYTVTATVSHAAATLQVGNPANLFGQPTLIVNTALTVSGEVVNDGTIHLDHPTTGTATLIAAPFTNNGQFVSVGPSPAVLNGNVVNDGSVLVDNRLTLQGNLATFTNRGTVTIGAGKELVPSANHRFHQNGGLLHVLGTMNVGSSFTDADIFYMNGGSVEGTVLITGRGGFVFGPDGTGPVDFEVHTVGPSIWYSGASHPGQTIRVISRNVGAALEIWSNVTNGGTLVFDSLAGAATASELVVAQGATTLTNSGRIEIGNTSLAAVKRIRIPALVNAATGVIDIRDAVAITGVDNAFTNSGSVTSAAGTAITTGTRTVVHQNGGELTVGGTFVLTGGFNGPSTFNFNAGNLAGELEFRGTARLNLGAAASGGRFLYLASGFGTEGFLGGPIAANQKVILRASDATGDVSVKCGTNVVNNGVISLQSTPGANKSAELGIPSGTLINNNLIEVLTDGHADATVRRRIRGNFDNHGEVRIEDHADLLHNATGNIVTNEGTFLIDSGARVGLGAGTLFRQNSGELNVLGSLFFEGPARQAQDQLNYVGGTVNGQVNFVGSGYLSIGPGAGQSGVFVFRSIDGLEAQNPHLFGNVLPGQTLILRGDNAGSCNLVVPRNLINGGTIMFDNAGTIGAALHLTDDATIADDGVLTNNGSIIVTAANPAAGKTIFGNVINHGTFDIHDDIAISGTNRFLTNHGTMNVFAGTVTLGNGHVVNQQAGVLRVDGQFLLQQGGNQGIDTFNFNGGEVIGSGDVILTEACRLNIGPGSEGTGRFVFGPGNGVLTGNIAAAQSVVLLGSTGGVNLTAPNGFTNAGRMLLDTIPTSTQSVTLNVTAGALANTGRLTVGNANLGSNKALNLVLSNGGIFEVLDTLTLNRTSAVHTNSGAVHVAPGQVLTVTGSSTWNNPGGSFDGGGQFTVANSSSFNGSGALGVNVRNEGRFRPGQSPGILNITGNYTQTSTGILDMEIGGSAPGEFDQINISGSATLGGTLTAVLFGSHCPAGGYPILTYASLIGDFATKTLNAGPGRTFTTVPGATSYLLQTNGPPCNTPPIAATDAYTTEAGIALSVAAPGVLGNDFDNEGDALSALLVDGPMYGALTLSSDGSFVYTPEPTYVPSDSFTYKANDGTVNSNTATVTITITDTLAPVTGSAASPEPNANGWNREDVTVTLTATDSGSGVNEVHYRINGGAEQIASGATASFTLTGEGVHTIEYFATDHAGNHEGVQTRIVRIDRTPPVVTAPTAVTQGTGPDATTCSTAISDAILGTATATDNLTDVQLARSGVPESNLFPAGPTTLTWTGTDLAGNSATATQLVTVIDDTPPSLQGAANLSRATDANSCAAFISDDDLGAGTATDNCEGVTVTRSGVPAGNLFPIGPTTITYTATDGAGNSTTAMQTVIVTDTTAPSLEAPVNVTRDTDANSCAALISDVDLGSATATDNCEGVTVTRSGVPAGNLFPAGPTTITYTATDAAGNITTATQTVIVTDTIAPSIQAPANVSRASDANSCAAFISDEDLGAATATDNCEGVTVTRSGVPAGNLFPAGPTTITYTATDAAGNSTTATQTVIVADTTAPSIQAPANVSRATDANSCAAFISDADLGAATATDNCDGVTVTRSGVPAGNLFPAGPTTITYTATDAAGNSITSTQTVIVTDTTAPSIQAPANVTRATDANSCAAFISDADLGVATATDNCEGVTVTRSGVPAGNLFPAGPTTITYTASDAAGNSTTASQTVILADTTAPALVCPANITTSVDAGSCSAVVSVTAPAVSDNCAGATVAGTRSDGQPLTAPYPVGTTTIQWVATDAAGNSAACEQAVTVLDTQAPAITNASATPSLLPADGNMHDVVVAYTTADHCGVAGSVLAVTSSEADTGDPDIEVMSANLVRLRGELAAGSAERRYTITITTADLHGNASSANLTVTVRAAETRACARLRQAEQQLLALIAANHPAADKLEDALDKVRKAIAKCSQVPPDRQGAAGEIEGAAGDIEAAIKDRLITSPDGYPVLQNLVSVARSFAVEAIEEAIERGGNRGQITAAQALLKVGDGFFAKNRFKDAIAKFKDALSKAEGA